MLKTLLRWYLDMSCSGTPMNRTEILVFVQSWENLRRKLVVSDTILFSSKITFFVRKKNMKQ